ncbi:hypothetical protein ABK040_002993 [Willaertia magna]
MNQKIRRMKIFNIVLLLIAFGVAWFSYSINTSKKLLEGIELNNSNFVKRIPISFHTNVFLLKGDKGKYILVDNGTPDDFNLIVKELTEKYNINIERDISLLFITHAHYDHAGSSSQFKKNYPSIPISVSSLEADYLTNGKPLMASPFGIIPTLFKAVLTLSKNGSLGIPTVKPDILIDTKDNKEIFSLEKFGVKAEVITTPGHSIGSLTVLLNERKIAILADLLASSFIYSNRPSWPLFVEDVNETKKSVQMLIEKYPTIETFYVSHGLPFSRQDLIQWFSVNKHII